MEEKRTCSWFYKCALVCHFCMCVFVSGFILWWAVQTKSVKSEFSGKSERSSSPFCTPCHHLVLSSASEDDYSNSFQKQTVTGDETGVMCCIEDGNTTQLDAYIRAKVEQQIRRDNTNGVPLMRNVVREITWEPDHPPPMAQLFAYGIRRRDETTDYNSLQPIKEYTHELDKAYKHGIQFDKLRGRVVILFTGYYDIVSHMSFHDPGVEGNNGSFVFAHEILRESRRQAGSDIGIKTDVLAKIVQEKQCPRRRDHVRSDISCHTSTLFTSFKLYNHDEIFVLVTRKDLVEMDGSTTFLRIRKIF